METKILGWEKSDCKSLIDFCLNNKEKSFSDIFKIWAKENNRQKYSVRNYFYKLLKLLKSDKNILTMLDLKKQDLKFLLNSKHFCLEDEEKLLYSILPTKGQKSVREACLKLAKNDLVLMLRYQNKYRNIIKKDREKVERVMSDLKDKNIQFRNPYQNNIISIKQNSKALTDDDLKSLFMGLVRLVKENADVKTQQQKNKLFNQKFQKTIKEARRKQILIEQLEDENKKLKKDFERMKSFVKSEKMEDLKQFLYSLSLKQSENLEK